MTTPKRARPRLRPPFRAMRILASPSTNSWPRMPLRSRMHTACIRTGSSFTTATMPRLTFPAADCRIRFHSRKNTRSRKARSSRQRGILSSSAPETRASRNRANCTRRSASGLTRRTWCFPAGAAPFWTASPIPRRKRTVPWRACRTARENSRKPPTPPPAMPTMTRDIRHSQQAWPA